jgi:hypothetical protein
MPQREFDDGAELAQFIRETVIPRLTSTPEGGYARATTPGVGQFYLTARTATRTLVMTRRDGTPENPLDIDLRDNAADPDFTRLYAAIAKAAQQERFR